VTTFCCCPSTLASPNKKSSVDIKKTPMKELVMKYTISHLNVLLGSFLGAFVSSYDLIMLPICFLVYVLLYTLFRQGHFTQLLFFLENDLNNSQPLTLNS